MISRGSKENFIVRHYEWLIAGIGGLVFLGAIVYYAMSLGSDAEAEAAEAVRTTVRKPEATGVEKQDIAPFQTALRQARTPVTLTELAENQASFLASARYVKCLCGKIVPGGVAVCPACKAELIVVNEKAVSEAKESQWQKRFGVEPNDMDKDGDGFTNAEEFAAGTDPTDAKDHPDYLDSLKLQLPLRETYVPFVLTSASKTPAGWRCQFFDAKQKDDFGRLGRTFTAVVGKEIAYEISRGTKVELCKTGFLLKDYVPLEERRVIAGTANMKRAVDASIATIVRISDEKSVKLVVQENPKSAKLTPIDVQATLVYERGSTQTFDVVPGAAITLSGAKYRVHTIKPVGKGAEVVLENSQTGKKQTLKALE